MTQVERAVSGRASCKACSAKIAKGELRVGVEAYGDFGPYVKWHHASCYAIASSGGARCAATTSSTRRAAPSSTGSRARAARRRRRRRPRRCGRRCPSLARRRRALADAAYVDAHCVLFGRAPLSVVGLQHYRGVVHDGELVDARARAAQRVRRERGAAAGR